MSYCNINNRSEDNNYTYLLLIEKFVFNKCAVLYCIQPVVHIYIDVSNVYHVFFLFYFYIYKPCSCVHKLLGTVYKKKKKNITLKLIFNRYYSFTYLFLNLIRSQVKCFYILSSVHWRRQLKRVCQYITTLTKNLDKHIGSSVFPSTINGSLNSFFLLFTSPYSLGHQLGIFAYVSDGMSEVCFGEIE